MQSIQAVLIAGPTASGKSSLAVNVANAIGGTVVNADSMQVYDVLSVLTARPQPHEMEGVEHALYGHVQPSDAYSVARYLEDVKPVLADLESRNIIPVFTGGTGLYFKALLDGLSDVPPIDQDIRADIRKRSDEDLPQLYKELSALDPDGALRLEPGDSQRICRALEVVRSTGKPLSWWHGRKKESPLLDLGRCLKVVLMPERAILRERIATRFGEMVEQGGLTEVRELLALDLKDDLPAMRAIGVQQLGQYLQGNVELDEAVQLAITATNQYAKRQSTWFRNQFLSISPEELDAGWHHAPDPKSALNYVIQSAKTTD